MTEYTVNPSGETFSTHGKAVCHESRLAAHMVAAKNAADSGQPHFITKYDKQIGFTAEALTSPHSSLMQVMSLGIPAYWSFQDESWHKLPSVEAEQEVSILATS